LSQHIGDYDQRIGELAAQRHPEVKRLTSIPGVGTLLCLRGYETIRLKTQLPLLGFNEQYSLECFSSR
jgi:hypothetical protein